MNPSYIFQFRRPWRPFFCKIKVIGHKFEPSQNKMVVFLPDGGVQEIARWSSCELRLGTDWVLAQQKALSAQAGQQIPLAVEGAK